MNTSIKEHINVSHQNFDDERKAIENLAKRLGMNIEEIRKLKSKVTNELKERNVPEEDMDAAVYAGIQAFLRKKLIKPISEDDEKKIIEAEKVRQKELEEYYCQESQDMLEDGLTTVDEAIAADDIQELTELCGLVQSFM